MGRHKIHIHRGGTTGTRKEERAEAKAENFTRGAENERPEEGAANNNNNNNNNNKT